MLIVTFEHVWNFSPPHKFIVLERLHLLSLVNESNFSVKDISKFIKWHSSLKFLPFLALYHIKTYPYMTKDLSWTLHDKRTGLEHYMRIGPVLSITWQKDLFLVGHSSWWVSLWGGTASGFQGTVDDYWAGTLSKSFAHSCSVPLIDTWSLDSSTYLMHNNRNVL